ncbi:DUF308 domain-containing protein [Methanolapillus ohkumae]|uniref:HdeD family acid-resistance protein n=1 Tax=Methanolapillus ohkumae TaxID=3028298 RepID=A0AA96V7D7_9EURY|nr:hypothetical protein MsAm2_09820 [Methanosarcinaceae archaeon Am2]
METVIEETSGPVRHWWIVLLEALLFIAAGFIFFFYPFESYTISFLTINIVVSVLLVVIGVLEIAFAFTTRNIFGSWVWGCVLGILTLILGLILIFNPQISELVLPYILAIWILIEGISMIGTSINMKDSKQGGWMWVCLGGILVILLGIIIIFNFELATLTFVYWVGFSFLFAGITDAFVSYKLYKAKKFIKKTTVVEGAQT